MRIIAWISLKLSRLFLFVGGLCALGLVAAGVSLLFGSDQFPAPFSQRDTGFATYAWQVGAMLVGSFVLWRGFAALVFAAGDERQVFAAMGREDEYDALILEEETRRAAERPSAARCAQCGAEFETWDEALSHSDEMHHGDDQALVRL